MSVIYILIALSLLVALGFLAAFLWAVRSGQYDDTHTPSMRILFDERHKTSQTSPPALNVRQLSLRDNWWAFGWRAGKRSKRHNNAKE